MKTLTIRNDHLKAIAKAAENLFPRECCGLLVGRGEEDVQITRVVPTENLSESDDRFLIDPQSQFDLIRSLRGADDRLIGHYHSHPNGRDHPSPHDAEMARDVGQLWLIAPVSDGQCGVIRAFAVGPRPQTFTSIQMRITDT